jgi:predicted nuclease with TOPRIM domain
VDGARYRKIFRDIVRGFSDTEVQNQKLYIKHLSSLDQVDIDEVKDFYYQKALDRGIPTTSEILEKLISDGTWSKNQDDEIDRLNNFIDQLKKNKTQIVLKSKLDEQNKQIEQTQKKINELESEKSALIGINAETYSEKRSNDYYIIKSFYEDPDLKIPVFPEENDFNDLYSEDVIDFIKQYNLSFEMFEETKIQEMILQDFYYIYFPFSDDTVGFFGNPVCHLTYNQLKLIVYTKIFKNIFERNVNIPESIKKDPSSIIRLW